MDSFDEHRGSVTTATLKIIGAAIGFIALILIISSFFYSSLSAHYPITVEVEKGMSSKEVIQRLRDKKLISSRTITNTLIALNNNDGNVVSGIYKFDLPVSTFQVIERITTGDFNIEFETITVVEGTTLDEIAVLFDNKLLNFDTDNFFTLVEKNSIQEGYLFPDTYRFLPQANEEDVIDLMRKTFDEKVLALPAVRNSPKTVDEIIIMASIVEKEATADSRSIVADILWERISRDMPLQVDAGFVYSIGKDTFQLTKADLEDTSNPYNTYVNRGLPPTAIGAPGIAAIEAAATPEPTEYLYFLTGADGNMYYAQTFEQHVRNKELYLE